MNWIERMYDLKGKDLYSQNGEGFYLEYIAHSLNQGNRLYTYADIGGGDGFYLSNVKHLSNLGWYGLVFDKENGININSNNIDDYLKSNLINDPDLISIDIDGNDYWIIRQIILHNTPNLIIAEFNAAFTDSRTIKYNPDHVWDGTDYYGFSFEAGKKLAEANGYKVIFQIANMNMIMVREDLIKVSIPEVKYEQVEFFEKSNREDWVFV